MLYGGARFRCRKCWNLAYQTQHEDAWSRAITKAQRFRRRLGASESLDEPFPDKPKRMHWRTYDRLMAKGEVLDERADRVGWSRITRLLHL